MIHMGGRLVSMSCSVATSGSARGSFIPCCFPAVENGWHGTPAKTAVAASHCCHWVLSWIGWQYIVLCVCGWWFVRYTSIVCGSLSIAAMRCAPRKSAATAKPPIPAAMSRYDHRGGVCCWCVGTPLRKIVSVWLGRLLSRKSYGATWGSLFWSIVLDLVPLRVAVACLMRSSSPSVACRILCCHRGLSSIRNQCSLVVHCRMSSDGWGWFSGGMMAWCRVAFKFRVSVSVVAGSTAQLDRYALFGGLPPRRRRCGVHC